MTAVLDWDRARYASVTQPSKARLLDHALQGMDPMRSGVFIARGVQEQVMLVLLDLVADAQPTPQMAVAEDGRVEALWIVNGTEVVFSVEPDGSGVLGAYSPEHELFEYEFDELNDPLDREKIAEARRLLNHLGESATHRVLA